MKINKNVHFLETGLYKFSNYQNTDTPYTLFRLQTHYVSLTGKKKKKKKTTISPKEETLRGRVPVGYRNKSLKKETLTKVVLEQKF